MAVRLGTQNWINPAPFAAAAEMVVDAGRAQGAGVAALGSGIGQGLQAYGAKQEREQRRQDILAQQSIENARASRAEDRAVKQSKIAVLEASLTASKMNVEMARQQYEALGTPESEAAYMKAVQDAQGTMNLYRMGVANHGEPDGQTTDYLGVGGATGPGGWPVGQSPSEKAARGEPTGDSSVYWNAKDYAESDAAMSSSGVVAPSARPSMQPSMEAAAELVTASDFLRAARDARNEAARIRASGKNRRTEALAQVKENDAAYLEANAQMKANDEKSAREQAEKASAKAAEEAQKSVEANASLRRLINPETGRPYLSMAEPDLPGPAASTLLEQHKAISIAGYRADRADAKQDDQQDFVMKKLAKSQEYAQTRMAQAKQNRIDIAAEARAAGIPMDQFRALFSEMDALLGQQRQLFGRAEDLWKMGRIGEAQAVLETAEGMDGDLNEMMRQLRDARLKIGQGPATADPAAAKQKVLDAFSALPPERQTDEEMLRMLKEAGLR